MTNQYPRGTTEWAAVAVEMDGVLVTTGVQFAVLPFGVPPDGTTVWLAPVARGDQIGIIITGLAPRFWQVWVKVTSGIATGMLIEGDYFVVD